MKKLIAITGADFPQNVDKRSPFIAARQAYIEYVLQTGSLAALVPNITDYKMAEKYAETFDGIIFTGGGDIHPQFYDTKQHKMTGALNQTVDTTRDESELMLFKAFFAHKKPILGICRGMQLINIAMGGTLTQHIDERGIKEVHMNSTEKGLWYVTSHSVQVDENSRLYAITNELTFQVNSAHHQMVKKPGKDLVISAKSPQSVPEAIEYMGDQFIVGVQWHPEQLKDSKESKAVIHAFINAS